jgi:hypothetical protein
MPCCGKARTPVRQVTPTPRNRSAAAPPSQPQPFAGQTAHFRYFGQTGITVTGPASSRVYRFSANGAPMIVDARDAAALARVPNLRMIRE